MKHTIKKIQYRTTQYHINFSILQDVKFLALLCVQLWVLRDYRPRTKLVPVIPTSRSRWERPNGGPKPFLATWTRCGMRNSTCECFLFFFFCLLVLILSKITIICSCMLSVKQLLTLNSSEKFWCGAALQRRSKMQAQLKVQHSNIHHHVEYSDLKP